MKRLPAQGAPMTATAPRLRTAKFIERDSAPYPRIVVMLQSTTAPPVSRIAFEAPPLPSRV